MSVIVRMEMPENCAVCPFVTEYSRCVFLGMYAINEERRADNCPIICKLPEEHGRLIDADAIEYLISENGCQDDVAYHYDINEMPTIVPAERSET